VRYQPRGVALEVRDEADEWVVVYPDLGFPAGKNKTMVIDVSGLFHPGQARRLRLRTNLEVYWDWIAYGEGVDPGAVGHPSGASRIRVRRLSGFSLLQLRNN